MTNHFTTIILIVNEENTKSELRAMTLKLTCYLTGISRHQV